MQVQAISNVNGYVNFGGRKKEASNIQSAHHSNAKNTLKAVPLAVLIAMSPMVNAQNNTSFYGPNDKIIKVVDCGNNIKINFRSIDGNDQDAEKLDITKREKNIITTENVDGVPTKLKHDKVHQISAESFVQKNRTTIYIPTDPKKESKMVTDTVYCVRGIGNIFNAAKYTVKDNKYLKGTSFETEVKEKELEIPKEVYDELKRYYSGAFPFTEENVNNVEHISDYMYDMREAMGSW